MTTTDTAASHRDNLRQDGRPIVLFLCVHNAGRSQMALGFFQHLAGDRAVAWSGGSEPGNPAGLAVEQVRPIRDEVERNVRRLLDELGIQAG